LLVELPASRCMLEDLNPGSKGTHRRCLVLQTREHAEGSTYHKSSNLHLGHTCTTRTTSTCLSWKCVKNAWLSKDLKGLGGRPCLPFSIVCKRYLGFASSHRTSQEYWSYPLFLHDRTKEATGYMQQKWASNRLAYDELVHTCRNTSTNSEQLQQWCCVLFIWLTINEDKIKWFNIFKNLICSWSK